MSLASHPLDCSAASGRSTAGLPGLSRRFELPVVVLAIACLLAGPRELLPPGFLLAAIAWALRGRAAAGWLARRGPLDAGWLLLLAGSLIGFAASFDPAAAWVRLGAVVAALTLFFWLQTWAARPDRLRQACWAVVVVCALGSLAILALIKGQLPDSALTRRLAPLLGLFAGFPGVSGDVLEVNSRFPVHQYGLAYLLLVIGPFLAAVAALGSGWVRRVAAGLGLLALAALLAATETRGALLALAVAVALVASLRSRWFWGLLPLGALAVYLLLARGIISRSIEAEWLAARLSIWTRSLDLLVDFPFSGAGLGMPTFAQVFAWTFNLPNPYLVVHSHNVFIQAYAEQGLLGLVSLAVVLIGGLATALRAARRAPAAVRPETAGLLGALTGSLLYGLTDQVPTTNDGLALLAALCGLAVAGGRVANLTPQPPFPTREGGLLRGAASPTELAPPSLVGKGGWGLGPYLALAGVAALLVGVAPRWISGLALNVGAVQVVQVALNKDQSLDQKGAALERAEAALAIATRWNRANTSAWRELARARLLRHDVPGALAALDQARSTEHLSDYERTQLGRIYFEIGAWQQAFDLWKQAGQADLLRSAADELSAKRDLKGAAAANAALVELDPTSAENLANLAKSILAAEGKVSVDEALQWVDRAAELNPDARRGLARQIVLEAEDCRTNERRGGGRFEACVFWFGLASRIDPTYDKPEVELGSVYFYRGRYAAAAEHFRAAAERDPRNSSSWHQLGEAEEAAGRLPAAVAAFEQAVRVSPNRGGLHASLGRVYAASGRCAEAARELNEALRLEPGNAVASAELAKLDECR